MSYNSKKYYNDLDNNISLKTINIEDNKSVDNSNKISINNNSNINLDINNLSNRNLQNNTVLSRRKRANTYEIDKDNKLIKINFPLDFQTDKYCIPNQSLDFYYEKYYVMDIINKINVNELFKFTNKYKLKSVSKIKIYFPYIILNLIVVYVFILLIFSTFINPGLFIIMYILLNKIYTSLSKKLNIITEKSRLEMIKEYLNKENNTYLCKKLQLKWSLGVNGYWIQINKLNY